MKSLTNRNGDTLVETLCSLAIFAVILIGFSTFISNITEMNTMIKNMENHIENGTIIVEKNYSTGTSYANVPGEQTEKELHGMQIASDPSENESGMSTGSQSSSGTGGIGGIGSGFVVQDNKDNTVIDADEDEITITDISVNIEYSFSEEDEEPGLIW